MKLFTCPVVPNTIQLKVTKKGCGNYYYLANKTALSNQNRSFALFEFCISCKIGKKNFKLTSKKLKIKKVETKICKLYEIAPDSCQMEKYNGIFPRSKRMYEANWRDKKYCSHECQVFYNQLIAKGLIK